MLKKTLIFLMMTGAVSYPVSAQENSASLHAVFQNVYQNHPALVAARHSLSATREGYEQARSGWLPRASAEASIVSTDIDTSNFRSGDGATTKGGSVVIEQNLFEGFRTKASVNRALGVIETEKSRIDQLSQDIFFNAARSYMDVIRDRLVLSLRAKNKDILETERRSVQARYDAGDVTNTDVRQTEARYSRAVADEAIAVSALRQSEAAYEEIVGTVPPEALEMPKGTPFSFPRTREELVAMAEKQNPGIERAAGERDVADQDIGVAESEFYPRLTAFASHAKEYDPQPGIVSETGNSAVGLRASISLYEGGATQSRVREAKSRASQRQAEITQARNAVVSRLVSDWKKYEALEAEIAARELEVTAARYTSKGAREEARLGERTVFDALEAEQDTLDAETQLVLAQRERIVTAYSLAASLGLLTPERLGLDRSAPQMRHVDVTGTIHGHVYPSEDYAAAAKAAKSE